MSEDISKARLFIVEEAGRLLGGISPWTLRKHIAFGNVKVTRIGGRVFLTGEEELERIRRRRLNRVSGFGSRESSVAPTTYLPI